MSREVEFSEKGLKDLVKESLEGLEEDLKEAQFNVDIYKKRISPNGSLETINEDNLSIYGGLLNDSLKIKGSIRDKFLKVIGIVKDKTAKETGGAQYDNTTIASLAEQIERMNNEESESED